MGYLNKTHTKKNLKTNRTFAFWRYDEAARERVRCPHTHTHTKAVIYKRVLSLSLLHKSRVNFKNPYVLIVAKLKIHTHIYIYRERERELYFFFFPSFSLSKGDDLFTLYLHIFKLFLSLSPICVCLSYFYVKRE